MPMPLILSSNSLLLSYRWLTISYSCPLIIGYKSVSAILVSPPDLKVVAAVDSVIVDAFGGILLTRYSFLL